MDILKIPTFILLKSMVLYKGVYMGQQKTTKSICDIIKQAFMFSYRPISWVTAFLGVAAMECFNRFLPLLGLTRIDNAMPNGTFFLPPGKKAYMLGFFMYFSGAVGFVSLFRALKPKMKGPSCLKSIKYGTGMFLFSSFIVLPVVGLTNPYMRRGILKKPGILGMGIAGWRTPLSSYLSHLIFSQSINTVLKVADARQPSIKKVKDKAINLNRG